MHERNTTVHSILLRARACFFQVIDARPRGTGERSLPTMLHALGTRRLETRSSCWQRLPGTRVSSAQRQQPPLTHRATTRTSSTAIPVHQNRHTQTRVTTIVYREMRGRLQRHGRACCPVQTNQQTSPDRAMLLARSSGGTHLSAAVEEPACSAHLPVIHHQLRSHSSLSASDCGKCN